VREYFIPVSVNIKEQPLLFRRFGAIWTPTAIILDSDGAERWRVEGYLPREEMHAQLALAVARIAAMQKRWADAEARYANVATQFADTTAAPEAIYWRAVSRYRHTRDHDALEQMAIELRDRFPTTAWAVKGSAWLR
jgi:TolA-binding protein